VNTTEGAGGRAGADLAFLLDDDPSETRTRLRELHCIATLTCGWNSPLALVAKQAAEGLVETSAALAAINVLPPLQRRCVLTAYGAIEFGGTRHDGRAKHVADDEDGAKSCPVCGRPT